MANGHAPFSLHRRKYFEEFYKGNDQTFITVNGDVQLNKNQQQHTTITTTKKKYAYFGDAKSKLNRSRFSVGESMNFLVDFIAKIIPCLYFHFTLNAK